MQNMKDFSGSVLQNTAAFAAHTESNPKPLAHTISDAASTERIASGTDPDECMASDLAPADHAALNPDLSAQTIWDAARLRKLLTAHTPSVVPPPRSAAVLLPLIFENNEPALLFEQRSFLLTQQPGDICYPGGAVEPGEASEEAAVRETMEELLISREQISILGALGEFRSLFAYPVHAFVGLLSDYRGQYSADEVDHVFSLPLRWFMEHAPVFYAGEQTSRPGEDFPFSLIPGGRDYPWARSSYTIPVYHDTSPLIWGMTARITHAFCELLRRQP